MDLRPPRNHCRKSCGQSLTIEQRDPREVEPSSSSTIDDQSVPETGAPPRVVVAPLHRSIWRRAPSNAAAGNYLFTRLSGIGSLAETSHSSSTAR